MGATRFADVVDSARRRAFVGRRTEIAGFEEALAGRSARRVLFVHGPGGIGKTTLLLEMRARARGAGLGAVLLDGREIDPSPEGLTAALQAEGAGDRTVLLIDGYEQLAPVDGWLRRELIPSLPARDVVVLAGREPPAPAWRTDPGWRQLVAVHPLDHLDDADSAELLARAGVAAADRVRLVRLGRGHPLALALLAEVSLAGTVPQTLAEVPDLISALLESLLRDAPSDAHMVGLATCAKAWLTTEDLLRETVGEAAPEVWAWLRRRPFVVCRSTGLSPHDLTRDVLDAEFERRSPARYRSLHRTIDDHVLAGIRATSGLERQLLAQHQAYLHQRSPLTTVYHNLRAQGSAAVTPARPEEYGQVVSMVERTEGSASADLAERWFADLPEHIDYLAFRPLVEVEVDGRRYVAYGHDWRRFPADLWWDLMTEREHSGGTGPPPESALRPPPLDRAGFGAAVRSALQQLNHPERLAGNPLLGTVPCADPAALRARVVMAVDRLAGEPKGDQLRAVLNRTFVRPAPSQEVAAEVLGLPFSTYRRYLARAIEAVTELLWSVEIGTVRW